MDGFLASKLKRCNLFQCFIATRKEPGKNGIAISPSELELSTISWVILLIGCGLYPRASVCNMWYWKWKILGWLQTGWKKTGWKKKLLGWLQTSWKRRGAHKQLSHRLSLTYPGLITQKSPGLLRQLNSEVIDNQQISDATLAGA
jgi:hypothetical protein